MLSLCIRFSRATLSTIARTAASTWLSVPSGANGTEMMLGSVASSAVPTSAAVGGGSALGGADAWSALVLVHLSREHDDAVAPAADDRLAGTAECRIRANNLVSASPIEGLSLIHI